MVNSIIPFPGHRAAAPSEDEERIRSASQEVIHALAAQPVPEGLLLLAAELGRALDLRNSEAPDPSAPGLSDPAAPGDLDSGLADPSV